MGQDQGDIWYQRVEECLFDIKYYVCLDVGLPIA